MDVQVRKEDGREMTQHRDNEAPVSAPRFDWAGAGFETQQVHAGEFDESVFDSRITPIYLSNAFRFDSFQAANERFAGTADGQLYSRNLNPTNGVAERKIAALEGGTGAIVVGSGQAAVAAVLLGLLHAGDHFVSTASIYSGTRIMFDRALAAAGIEVTYVLDYYDRAEWEAAIRPSTKLIFTETIPNPKNDIVDIAVIAQIARDHGFPLVVDNTVATPYLIRPIEHGANIVVHSGTKFLAGHGAGISGVIVDGGNFDWSASDFAQLTTASAPGKKSFVELFGNAHVLEGFLRNTTVNDYGPSLSAFNAFLLQQGIETLSLRMERHNSNALAIAQFLEQEREVESVDYAGLPSNKYYPVAQKYTGGAAGSVFAFTLAGGRPAAEIFFNRLEVFSRMTNIGDTRSMALHPATTTHLSFDDETRDQLGISPGLIRLSVGIETVSDLIADLSNALAAVAGK